MERQSPGVRIRHRLGRKESGQRTPHAELLGQGPRIDTLGELDELNSSIGVLLAEPFPSECQDLHAALLTVQNHLFDLGGEICIPGHKSITEEHVAQLEGWAEVVEMTEDGFPAVVRAGGLHYLAGNAAGSDFDASRCIPLRAALVELGGEAPRLDLRRPMFHPHDGVAPFWALGQQLGASP